MKKKIVIPIIFVLLIGVTSFILWNNRTVSTITLDINPSIKINLNKKGKVKNVLALNNDAKDIIKNIKTSSLDETLKNITNNIINNGYSDDDQVFIILYSTGNINNEEIEHKIKNNFEEKNIFSDIIIIEDITKEDEKVANKYNISPAKASYINSITNDNKNIDVKDLIDKPVMELKETKETGRYCNEGYNLEGDFCLKETKRIDASSGMVCPKGYYEYEGTCYEEIRSEDTDNLICRDTFTLDGNKCSRIITIEAEPSNYNCTVGEAKTRAEMNLTDINTGDANNIVCVDYSNATHPQSPCELNDGTEYTVSAGVCYWHRAPVIAEGCPGKILVNGMCWDDASNIYICSGYRDGKQYKSRDEYCENSIKYIDPIITEYKCPEDYTLNNDKCEKEEKEDAWYDKICPTGYTKVNNDRCINLNKSVNKEKGLVCDGYNTKLKENACIIYEIVESKHN